MLTTWLTSLRTALSQPKRSLRHRNTQQARTECLEERALLAAQVIMGTPETQAARPSSAVAVDIEYSTQDDSGNPAQINATILGLRIHFDSTELTWQDATDIFAPNFDSVQLQADTSDFDGDASTDSFVLMSWINFSSPPSWPGTTQPLQLLTANFQTSATFSGPSTINFTRSSTPTNLTDFVSNNPTVTDFIEPNITIADTSVTEGGDAQFDVTLSEAPSGDVTVTYSTANGSANSADYTVASSQTITFTPGGPLTQAISIPTTDDGTVEPDENFFVNLISAVNGNITDNQAEGTITNDDQVVASIADAGTVNEGAIASFQVTLDQAPLADVVVTLSTQADTADAGTDFTAVTNQQLTFTPANWNTPQSISTTVTDDTDTEPDEVFQMVITGVSGGTASLAAGSANATIPANDPPSVSISNSADVPEGSAASFSVTLSGTPAVPLTVDFSTATDSAGAGDFESTNVTLTFTPTGPLTQNVLVATTQDSEVESSESFFANLSNVANGSIATAQATATIVDNDVPVVSIFDAASVAEGFDAEFAVSLDQAPVAPVTVEFSTSNDTTSASDFTSLTTTVTFNPGGPLSQQVNVATLTDGLVEPDETFFATLTSATGGTIGTAQATGTITSSDVPAVSISDPAAVAEGSDVVFTVFLDVLPLAGQDITVTVATADGSATDGNDYTAVSQQLTFTSTGSPSQQVTVGTTNDTDVEADETFTLDLTSATGATISTATATATITSEDVPAASIDDLTVAEGGTATFTVTLDQAPVAPVTLTIASADGTATAPADYTALAASTVSFAVGETTQTVDVATIDDSLVEPDESFSVMLSSPSGATLDTAVATATVTSDDLPTVSVADANDVAEGGIATFAVSVDQLPLAGQDLSVTFATSSGTATSAVDFTEVSQTVIFTSASTLSQQVQVTTTDDSLVEATENFTVALSSVVNGSIGTASAAGNITSDDVPTVSVNDASGNEGDDVVFTVSLDQLPLSDVTVEVATTDGTAVSPDDFAAVATTTLTFTPAGSLTQDVTVTTVDDILLEDLQENFTLSLSNVTGAAIGDGTGEGTIINDDNVTVSISDATPTSEGTEALLIVTLNETPQVGQDVSITVNTVDGSATAGSDFTAVSQTLTFTSADPLTQEVRVPLLADGLVEANEDFTVELSNPVNATIAQASGSGTIISADEVEINIGGPASVEEGQDAVFTVSLDQAPLSAVTVTLSTMNGSAEAPGDFTAIADLELTFNPGESLTQEVTVTTIDDTDGEQAENFSVDISSVSGGTLATDSAPITLIDNEFTARPVIDPIGRFTRNLRPTISWTNLDGAAGYELWMTRVFPGEARVFEAESMVTTNSFTPSADLTPGLYRLWVQGQGANGGFGPWSNPIEFEIRPELRVPVIPTFSRRPTFEWDAIPFADSYELFIRTTSGDVVVDNLTETRHTPVSDLARGPVRWWVRAADATFNNGWSTLGTTGTRTEILTPTNASSNSTPTFTWKEVEGAGRYVIVVQNLDSGSIVLREDDATGTSYNSPVSFPAGNYRTWIKAVDALTNSFSTGQWSPPEDFIVKSSGQDSELPSLDTQVTSPEGVVTEARPTITWAAAEGAARYRVYLYDLDNNSVVVDDANVVGTSYTPADDLDGNYRVWVRAIAGTGRRGAWSAPTTFQVVLTAVEPETESQSTELVVFASTESARPVSKPVEWSDVRDTDVEVEASEPAENAAADVTQVTKSTSAADLDRVMQGEDLFELLAGVEV